MTPSSPREAGAVSPSPAAIRAANRIARLFDFVGTGDPATPTKGALFIDEETQLPQLEAVRAALENLLENSAVITGPGEDACFVDLQCRAADYEAAYEALAATARGDGRKETPNANPA